MSARTFLSIVSVIALLYGIGDVLIPAKIGAFYGFEVSRSTELIAQFLGVVLLGWGLLFWFVKDLDAAAQHAALVAAGVGNAVGVVVAAMGVMSGVMNGMGWMIVALFAFEAIGCVYFLSAERRRIIGA